MNENWEEIVESLSPYFKSNTEEVHYQHEIENCLKILGWKKSNGTMKLQERIDIGNNNSIRPDIILYKKDENGKESVLPIEIKRPDNNRKKRQEKQLLSYMRQLSVKVGLYIGEDISLYYDDNNLDYNLCCVFSSSIKSGEKNGAIICNLLDYNKFDIRYLEEFCNDQYKKILARNNLHKRISEFLSTDCITDNILTLIRDKFMTEGFDETAINEELTHLKLTAEYSIADISKPTMNVTERTSQVSQQDNKDLTHYSFDGVHFHNKRRFVLELIKQYVTDHHGITFEELEKQFPYTLHSKSLGVVRRLCEVQERIEQKPDFKKRYFLKPNEIICLNDGTEITVTNQWGNLFPKFLAKAMQLYNITNDKEPLNVTPRSQQHTEITTIKITFKDGTVIQGKNTTEAFYKFISYVGAERVQALGILRNKIPLVSSTIDSIYGKRQKHLGEGLYLMTNTDTRTKIRDIKYIADSFNLDIKIDTI